MKELLILRKQKLGPQGGHGTFGGAFAGYDDSPVIDCSWHSGELAWVDENGDEKRDSSLSCVKAGTYYADQVMSPKRGIPVYQLVDVPDAVAIQIHSGNFCGRADKGFVAQVEGCILLGRGQGALQTWRLDAAGTKIPGPMQEAILESKAAIADFMAWANGERIKVRIEEQFAGAGAPSGAA